ncbi:hypothetical protein VCHC68A1_02420B, partial [Vibrio cholerae HC-68A1]
HSKPITFTSHNFFGQRRKSEAEISRVWVKLPGTGQSRGTERFCCALLASAR